VETKTETFDERWQRLADSESTQDIVARFEHWTTEKIFGDELSAAARTILEALKTKLESTPENGLAIARAARAAFDKMFVEVSHKHLIHCVETEWEPWKAKLFYKENLVDRPSDSKYSLVEIAAYKETVRVDKSQPQGTAPNADDFEI
jgi:hypothetical protein